MCTYHNTRCKEKQIFSNNHYVGFSCGNTHYFAQLSYPADANPCKPLPLDKEMIENRKHRFIFEPKKIKNNENMEIINIEARTFEAMETRFAQFAKRVEELCGCKDKSLQKWLDNQDVCLLLNISKRTLQTYRDNGTLPYSQIGHKMYYKSEDVERTLNQLKTKQYGN